MKEPPKDRVALRIHHDEDVEVYLNGVPVFSATGYTTGYETAEIKPEHLSAGGNTIAISCIQTSGGQYIDAGIDALIEKQ